MSRAPIEVRAGGQVVVTGSLAFDHIMIFPGFFKDHILPEKTHSINVSFLVNELRKQRGGCAANIGYTLALLGERPRLVAAAGKDFGEYGDWLREQGVDTEAIFIDPDEVTPSCFITTDQTNNQITGFYVGAMPRAKELSLRELAGPNASVVIVAPDDPEAMVRHCREAREAGIPFLFDPSFQVTAMDGEALTAASQGASAVVLNDYELAVFEKKTGKAGDAIFDLVDMVIVTLGKDGSKIRLSDGREIDIPAAAVGEVLDPTGAGDAFRGGFLAGLQEGYDLEICGRMASVAAAYAIENHGPQNHAYTREEFEARYAENFGPVPAAPVRS